jgi:hypothetical protein
LLGPRFSPASLVKTWVKELKAFKDRELSHFGDDDDVDANASSEFNRSGPEAALVPVLGYSTESVVSLQYLQASFQADSSLENLLALITGQYPLNQKQRMVIRALFLRIDTPFRSIYLDHPYSTSTKGRATAPVKLSIGEALEFSDLRILAAFFEDGPGRDATTLHNVRFLSISYLDDHADTGWGWCTSNPFAF